MTDDREILAAFRDEDRKDYAFNLLVRKYSEPLYWHIRRAVAVHEDADDLLQNTLMKAWKYLPEFREESRLYTWLYRIATNETINFLKSRRLKAMISITGREKALYDKYMSGPDFNGDDITRKLYKAISKLPPRQKMIFNMRYFDEMKFNDIAEILRRTTGSVKASYHHAYTKILQYMNAND